MIVLIATSGIANIACVLYIIALNKEYQQIRQWNQKLISDITRKDSEKERIIEEHEQKFSLWAQNNENRIRKDALDRSRYVQNGQTSEHFAPFLIPDLNPKDARFIGDPIDFLICNGSTHVGQTQSGEIESVMLLDVKTGKAKLSKVQRAIRDAIVAGKFKFATYNSDTKVYREWQFKTPIEEDDDE
jgi:predicted Holliday junction resolvase-like endonuclease